MNRKILSKEDIIKLVSPIDTVKWLIQKTKQHKVLLIISVVLALFQITQVAYCGGLNLSALYNFVCGGGGGFIMDTLMNDLVVNIDTGVIGQYTRNIYDSLITIGQALAILMWLIGLGEISMRDDLTAELIARDCLKIIAILIIIGNYGYDILTGLVNFFNALFIYVEGIVGVSPDVIDINGSGTVFSEVPYNKMGTILLALGILALFKIWINIAVAVVIWTRKIKIVLYAALAPIGLYDYRDGFHSSAANYIRKFASLCVQGVFILISNRIVLALFVDIIGLSINVGTNVFDSLLELVKIAPLMLVLVTFMKSTEQISSDLIGAH